MGFERRQYGPQVGTNCSSNMDTTQGDREVTTGLTVAQLSPFDPPLCTRCAVQSVSHRLSFYFY